jgi:hypothetical protein
MPEPAKRKDLPKPDFPEVKIVQAGGGAKSEPVKEDAKTEDEA